MMNSVQKDHFIDSKAAFQDTYFNISWMYDINNIF